MADQTSSSGANPSGDEAIGSLGQETIKLIRAIAAERLRAQDGSTDVSTDGADVAAELGTPTESTHVCTTGWCPICQVVGYVQDHPELVEQVTETVTDAAVQIGRVVRDFLDKTMPPEK